ncbi:YlbL family protein [Cumulibacter manganitolerans]|uniref:YlbL family protein n=1 Tax=Cumulibacter manganitolerans TaxID=1884992 RepID=UPI00129520C9|nr:PDZ domain-containing protein [Cumulibacter manganitolerans]
MTRRAQTLLSGTVVLAILVWLLALIRVPYVAWVPGPTVNTLGSYEGKPVIVVDGKTPNQTDGHLNLTTVGVVDDITIIQAITGWFSSDTAIVPREVVYPPTKSRDQIDQANRADYVQSESSAIQAAMNYLGYPKKIIVVQPPKDAQIAAGDALEKVDGTAVATTDELAAVMAEIAPGTTITVDYLHDGQPVSTQLTTQPPPKGRSGSVMGMTVNVRGYGGFSVSFSQNDIGGPSAGLMLTLGIIDLVGPSPIVGGEFIAGTGTIDSGGKVGPIGGIRFKLMKATEVGAKLFLTPAENCAEAMTDPPAGAPVLAKVEKLQDAIDAIAGFRAGKKIATCS